MAAKLACIRVPMKNDILLIKYLTWGDVKSLSTNIMLLLLERRSYAALQAIMSSLFIGKSNINFKMRDGRTALIWAAIAGKSEAVNSLIMNKADLNIADNDGKTALMFAAENGDYASVEYLINAGAHLNTLDKFSKTALMYAMENGNTDVVDLLTRASLAYKK